MTNFSKMQRRVFDTFRLRGYDVDVSIEVLFASAYPDTNASGMTSRMMQMKIGSLFMRMNNKMLASKIVVGQVKQTYRLTRKA